MVESKQCIMLIAEMPHSKMNGGAVLRCCQHHPCHNQGDVEFFLSLLWLSRLVLFRTLAIVKFTLLIKELRHSGLLPILLPRTLGELRDSISCQPHLGHSVEYRFVWDGVRRS